MTNALTNIITDRKEMAQALNFGKYKVLQLDMDTNKGSIVATPYKDSNGNSSELSATGGLRSGYKKEDDGILYVSKHSSILTATRSVSSWVLDAEKASAVRIHEGDEVAVLCHSEKNGIAFVRLVVAVSVKPDCAVLMRLKDIQ